MLAFDNHVHLRAEGRGVDAVAAFVRKGGTGFNLINYPRGERTVAEFTTTYRTAIDLAAKVRAIHGIPVVTTIGPYPVSGLRLAAETGIAHAEDIMRQAVDVAAALINAGEAEAMGEIGRPHFQVSAEEMAMADRVIEYAMGVAADGDFPVILHTEHAEPSLFEHLAGMADRAGLARGRVVKHYSGPFTLPAENHGLVPSVIASRSNVRAALAKGGPFLLETDFLDDPDRPGAVMDITTVPKRVAWIAQAPDLDGGELQAAMAELPIRLYGPERFPADWGNG